MFLLSTSSIAHCPLCILRTWFCDDHVVDCLVATEGFFEVDVRFTHEAILRWSIFTCYNTLWLFCLCFSYLFYYTWISHLPNCHCSVLSILVHTYIIYWWLMINMSFVTQIAQLALWSASILNSSEESKNERVRKMESVGVWDVMECAWEVHSAWPPQTPTSPLSVISREYW